MKRVYRVQRLARTEEKAVVKRIFWLTILSILLIGAIFTVGANFLGKFADFLERILGVSNNESELSEVLRSPIIDDLPDFSNEKNITISGFASSGSKVEIYLDSKKIGESALDGSSFEYQNLSLVEGDNVISAKSLDDSGSTSDFSEDVIIILDTEEPELEIIAPSDGQNFFDNNRIKVGGETEKQAQVFANGFLANVDSDGNFEVTIFLSEGENKIEVRARDEAGNEKTKEIKVNFKK